MDQIEVMRAFVRVVELGTFSEAARALNVNQSTISKWVSQLESQLNTQLIERTTRARHLTDAGVVFYESALRMLDIYDETITRLHSSSLHPAGRLCLSAPVVFGQRFVLPHLAEFMRSYPLIELDVRFSDAYVNMVEQGVDVAVRIGTPVDSSLRARTLARIPRVLVASPNFLHHNPIDHPDDLRECSCLVHSGPQTPTTWRLTFDQQSYMIPVSGSFTANLSDALIQMAVNGLGVALVAKWLVQPELDRGALVDVLPGADAGIAFLQVLSTPGTYTHPKVDAFAAFMRDVVSQQAISPAPVIDSTFSGDD